MILFDKTGSANWTVPWHQDRSIAVRERIDVAGFGPWSNKSGIIHVQPPLAILERMLTLRFNLDPCGSESGPLRVLAATHRRILEASEVEAAVATMPQTVCATGAGGLVVMWPLILHASSPGGNLSAPNASRILSPPTSLPATPSGAGCCQDGSPSGRRRSCTHGDGP